MDPLPAPAYSRSVSLALDALLFAMAGVWLLGGVEWHDRRVLTHAADLRRAALLLALGVAWAVPAARDRSLWLRAGRRAWELLKVRRIRWVTLVLGFLLMSGIGALQSLALRVPLYDVGIFHQILWSVAHGHGFHSTISGAGNFLLDHLSPTLALLVPAFWIGGSSPLTLSVMQPMLLLAGVSAWVWLAERLDARSGRGGTLAAAATLFALTFDSLWGSVHWGFHENAIAFASLSWAYALIFENGASGEGGGRRRAGAIFVLMLIAGLSKEILLVDVALALAAWAALDREASRASRAGRVVAALAMIGAFIAFEKLHHPADKNYFDRYYSYLGHDLGTFARTLLLSPWKVVERIGAGELVRYFGTVFLPWLFLPLLALARDRRRGAWLVALLPSFASAALSTDFSLRRASFHYVLELWPLLAALTLTQLARLRAPRLAAAWALLALLAWDHDPVGLVREYARGAVEQAQARSALAAIPQGDSVTADELAGPWVANRLEVTRWPALEILGGRCPDWVVLRGETEIARARELCGVRPESGKRVGEWVFFRSTEAR